MAFTWPAGFEVRPLLTHVSGRTAYFKDGSSRDVDAIVLCTGYLHHFPFLEESLRLRTNNRLYPLGLYKGVFWQANPKLIYLGMQDQFFTFNMFDAQAWYARDVVLGRIALPDAAAIAQDIAHWRAREERLETAFDGIDFQADYILDLLAATDYPPMNVRQMAELFKQWEHHKVEGIVTYRDRSYPSTLTGTMAPKHHTKWMQAMDDSFEAFLGS
jgi:trimethylamine monooxygenase